MCKLTGCLTLINVAWKSENGGKKKRGTEAAVETVGGAGCVCVCVCVHAQVTVC